jgi:hypothetical protein
MANVGSLTVSLTALTGRFSKGMRKAGREVQSLAASVGAMSAKLASMSTAAATVAAGAVAYLTHRQAEMIDSTAKVADRLGETTEALIGMRHAANLAGVGTEEFDKAQEKLSKNLGNPSKDVAEALDKIGLSATSLLRMSPAQRFSAIADGINKLGSQSEKAAVATSLFGKTGANLLNTFDLGSAGLAAAATEANKLGMAFSRVDAAQVEEANDQVTKLHGAFDSVFQKLAIRFAPFITELTDKLISLGADGTSVADAIADGAINMARSMLRVVDVVDLAKGAFYALGATMMKVQGLWDLESANVTQNVADLVNFFAPGTISEDIIQGEMQERMDKIAERDRMAVLAFAESRKNLADAINGERSGAARAGFDSIIAAANARAQKTVSSQAADRTAASANERKKAGEALAAGFTSFLSKSKKLGQDILTGASGSVVVDEFMGKIAGFFRSLPERALKAGFMPTMDLQTTTRGTFSGETAGRQTSVMSVQTKQLETQRQMLDQLAAMRGSLAGGIALP